MSSAPCIGFEVEECTVDNATWTTWASSGSGGNFRDIERLLLGRSGDCVGG